MLKLSKITGMGLRRWALAGGFAPGFARRAQAGRVASTPVTKVVPSGPPGGSMGTALVTGGEATRPACAWDTKPGAKPAAKVSAMSPIPVILDSLSISPSYVCLCLPGDVREGRDNGLQLSGCQDPS